MKKKTPTIIEGVVLAAGMAAAAAGAAALASLHLLGGLGLRAAAAAITFTYILYLLKRLPAPAGRFLIGICAFTLLLLLLSVFRLPLVLLVAIAIIWLIRSFLAYASPVSAVIDAGLCFAAACASVWVFAVTRSVVLGVWTFFLIQALFVLIPAKPRAAPAAASGADADRFAEACKTAETALAQLLHQA